MLVLPGVVDLAVEVSIGCEPHKYQNRVFIAISDFGTETYCGQRLQKLLKLAKSLRLVFKGVD